MIFISQESDQEKILAFFKTEAMTNKKYYTISEVQTKLKGDINPKTIYNRMEMLYAFGFLIVRVRKGIGSRLSRREFRYYRDFP